MKTEHLELRKRVEDFSLDDPTSAFPFSQRLARDNGWPLAYAERVICEYKRFAFLAVTAGHPVTPSDQVDQAWHLHLLYTRSYWKEFCSQTLRTPLHHGPTKGGTNERHKFNDWYHRTLTSYHEFFGDAPPGDIWPAPSQRFGEDIHFARVNTARNWIVPKPAWMRNAKQALSATKQMIAESWLWRTPKLLSQLVTGKYPAKLLAMVLTAALALGGCTGAGDLRKSAGWPFDLTAGPFLLFFLILWVTTTSCAAWLRRRARTPVESPDDPTSNLDAYDWAFLAGGKNRALFAAVANLTRCGAVEIDEKEHRLRPANLSGPAHPFEARIHHQVVTRTGSTFKEILDQCAAWAEYAQIEQRLKELRLLTTERWSTCYLPMLIALIVPAIGFVKIGIGITRDKPVGILILLSILSLVLALWFAVKPHRTRRGDAVLSRFRAEHAGLENGVQTGGSNMTLLALPLAVGLFGPAVLNATPLAKLEEKLQANAGGSQGGGCGGGCGGGGCGGGCGGCGGCGG